LIDEEMMRLAIGLARTVDLAGDPNPAVGAVIVKDGTVVGRGWHTGAGTAHAEVVALSDAGGAARGATAYVTLEPCNAHGRTGPCTEALVRAGVSRVVYGQADPNPVMAGGGDALRASGVAVSAGVLATECQSLNESWTFAMRTGRPWVVWKTATSIDGFIAGGTDRWITGEDSRALVQVIRAGVGAIVTGTGTVLADDPRMTVRDAARQPLRVVMGARPVPEQAKIRPFLAAGGTPAEVLSSLWRDHGIHRVLLEAGRDLSTSFWRDGLVDEVYWFTAPVALGHGVRVLGELPQALGFRDVDTRRVGLDVLAHFRTR
jgi:diaminohydroxyphosphoribosylaminopyrimidine deaminase/5-amino-6-(5-phosphoribosylamino)uracil reductase